MKRRVDTLNSSYTEQTTHESYDKDIANLTLKNTILFCVLKTGKCGWKTFIGNRYKFFFSKRRLTNQALKVLPKNSK